MDSPSISNAAVGTEEAEQERDRHPPSPSTPSSVEDHLMEEKEEISGRGFIYVEDGVAQDHGPRAKNPERVYLVPVLGANAERQGETWRIGNVLNPGGKTMKHCAVKTILLELH